MMFYRGYVLEYFLSKSSNFLEFEFPFSFCMDLKYEIYCVNE